MANTKNPWEMSDEELSTIGGGKNPWEMSPEEIEGSVSQSPWYNVSPEGVGKAFVQSIPMAASMAGGAVGLLGGPGTAIGGAALGAMGGKALQNVIESGYGEGPQSAEELYKGILHEGVTGAGAEVGGQAITGMLDRTLGLLPESWSPVSKVRSEEIKAAGNRLGFEPSPGMVLENPQVQQLESSLSQSPTLYGSKYTKKYITPARESIASKTEEALAEGKGLLPSEYGAQAKGKITEFVENQAELPSLMFQEIKSQTQNMGVSDLMKNRLQSNIMNIEGARIGPSRGAAEKWANEVSNLKTVDDIKLLRTQAQRAASAINADPNEKFIASQVIEKLIKAERSQVLRNALASSASEPEGRAAAKEIIDYYKDARLLWAELYKDIAPIRAAGVGKRAKTYVEVLRQLDEIPDEKIADKLFTSQNRSNLAVLKDRIPEAFETLRLAKIDALREKSMTNGQINLAKLLSNVKGLEQPTREMIFGEQSAQILRDLETVKNAMPKMVGPSGTPQGIEVMNYASPFHWGNELSRLIQSKLIERVNSGGVITKPTVNLMKPAIRAGSQGLLYKGRGE